MRPRPQGGGAAERSVCHMHSAAGFGAARTRERGQPRRRPRGHADFGPGDRGTAAEVGSLSRRSQVAADGRVASAKPLPPPSPPRMRRYLPLAIAATSVVVVLPALLVNADLPHGSLASTI